MKKSMSEVEIEKQMEKALDKIPFEIKKIKFILSLVKKINRLKMFFKIK